jgi:hypothetical protein
MPSFQVNVPHAQEPSQIAERLKTFSDRVRGDLTAKFSDVVEQWDDQGNLNFSFSAMGFKVSGRMENRPTSVYVNGNIPFAALPFRGMIEKQLAEKIREAIAVV